MSEGCQREFKSGGALGRNLERYKHLHGHNCIWKRQSLFNWIGAQTFYCHCHCFNMPRLSCYFQQVKWAFVSILLEWLNPKEEKLKWESEKAASSCYVPNTGVLCASSGSMWGCCREVSWSVRPLISDFRASIASGWVSRKPRSQKAAGPALHWETKQTNLAWTLKHKLWAWEQSQTSVCIRHMWTYSACDRQVLWEYFNISANSRPLAYYLAVMLLSIFETRREASKLVHTV